MNGTAIEQANQTPRYVAPTLTTILSEQGRMQRWLAERVQVSESLVSKLCAGERTVDRALSERIASALGVPFGVLFEIRERNDSVPPSE